MIPIRVVMQRVKKLARKLSKLPSFHIFLAKLQKIDTQRRKARRLRYQRNLAVGLVPRKAHPVGYGVMQHCSSVGDAKQEAAFAVPLGIACPVLVSRQKSVLHPHLHVETIFGVRRQTVSEDVSAPGICRLASGRA